MSALTKKLAPATIKAQESLVTQCPDNLFQQIVHTLVCYKRKKNIFLTNPAKTTQNRRNPTAQFCV